MKRIAFVLPLLGLVACGGVVTPQTQTDAAACAQAVLASGATTPQAMIAAALLAPACAGLTQDVLNSIISKTMAQRARMAPQ